MMKNSFALGQALGYGAVECAGAIVRPASISPVVVTISSVETAAMVGSMSKRISSNIRRGSVTAALPDRNSATSNSSNEVMNANTAPGQDARRDQRQCDLPERGERRRPQAQRGALELPDRPPAVRRPR